MLIMNSAFWQSSDDSDLFEMLKLTVSVRYKFPTENGRL